MYNKVGKNGDWMTVYEGKKRVVARGITFIDNNVLLIERYRREGNKLLHYFTIPGGGVEENETYLEAAIRETMEETTVKTEEIEYLEKEDYGTGICYWFYLKYLSGTPTLGGEEKIRNNPDNSYKVVLIDMKDIDKVNILGRGRDLIKKCYQKYKI